MVFYYYNSPHIESLELPGDLQASELHFWQASKDAALEPPKTVAWLTGPGIYHGSLSYSSQEAGDGVIESAQLLPYPATSSPTDDGNTQSKVMNQHSLEGIRDPSDTVHAPLSMILTAFHFIILYKDRVKVVRMLDDRVVHEEVLDIVSGKLRVLSAQWTAVLKSAASLDSLTASRGEGTSVSDGRCQEDVLALHRSVHL